MDEKPEDIIARGEEAETLLNHPAFKRTVDRLSEANMARFFTTDPDQQAQREEAYLLNHALQSLVNGLVEDKVRGDKMLEQISDPDDGDVLPDTDEEIDFDY